MDRQEQLKDLFDHYVAELKELERRQNKVRAALDGIRAAAQVEGVKLGDRKSPKTKGLKSVIESAVLRHRGETITVRTIVETGKLINEGVINNTKNSSISSALRRLSKEWSILELVREGSGKRPSTYQVKSDD